MLSSKLASGSAIILKHNSSLFHTGTSISYSISSLINSSWANMPIGCLKFPLSLLSLMIPVAMLVKNVYPLSIDMISFLPDTLDRQNMYTFYLVYASMIYFIVYFPIFIFWQLYTNSVATELFICSSFSTMMWYLCSTKAFLIMGTKW